MDSLDLIGSGGTSNPTARNGGVHLLEDDSANLIESESLLAATNQVQRSQDQEELTTGEVLQRLQDAWINEKFAPDLLEHQNEVVECLLNQISETEQRINSERLQRKKDPSKNFGSALYKMEIARVRFVISSYLRTRLEKIQRFVFYLLEQESKVIENGDLSSSEHMALYSRMSENELTFARQYRINLTELFERLALDHMPGKSKEFNPVASVTDNSSSLQPPSKKIDPPPPQPNLNSAVFVKAVADVKGVYIQDDAGRGREEEYDMIAGSQHILSYKTISEHLRIGSVKLI